MLQGVEAHADVQMTSQLVAELGLDYVRGTLTDGDAAAAHSAAAVPRRASLSTERVPGRRRDDGEREQERMFSTESRRGATTC